MPALAAEVTSSTVLPLGIFSAIKATADHTYGHEVRLWRAGDRVVGQMTYWDANLEGQRGRFDDGAFNPQTGEVNFNVTMTRRDVQPNIRLKASFRGYLGRGGLWGRLTWEGEGAQTRNTAGVEKLNLLLEKGGRLKIFRDIEAWRNTFEIDASLPQARSVFSSTSLPHFLTRWIEPLVSV
jgi:hypothetical protein